MDNRYPVYDYALDVWHDVGSPERYLSAMLAVLHGDLDIRILEEKINPNRNIWVQGYSEESNKRREEIIRKYNDGRLSIEDAALIGRHTSIGDHSRIVTSNIDNFCILGEYVTVEKSAIMDAARIGDYAHVSDSILGRKVLINSTADNRTSIERNSVIGNGVTIRKGRGGASLHMKDSSFKP